MSYKKIRKAEKTHETLQKQLTVGTGGKRRIKFVVPCKQINQVLLKEDAYKPPVMAFTLPKK